MGGRRVVVRQSAARSIAAVAWFIEAEKGMIATAEKFSSDAYDFIEKLANPLVVHAICRDEERRVLGLKCRTFKKKYTVVFIETDTEIVVSEFLSSKLIK